MAKDGFLLGKGTLTFDDKGGQIILDRGVPNEHRDKEFTFTLSDVTLPNDYTWDSATSTSSHGDTYCSADELRVHLEEADRVFAKAATASGFTWQSMWEAYLEMAGGHAPKTYYRATDVYTSQGRITLKAHSKVSTESADAELHLQAIKAQVPYKPMSLWRLRRVATRLSKRVSWIPKTTLLRLNHEDAFRPWQGKPLATMFCEGWCVKGKRRKAPFVAFFHDECLTLGVLLHELAHLKDGFPPKSDDEVEARLQEAGSIEEYYHGKVWQEAFRELQHEVKVMGLV